MYLYVNMLIDWMTENPEPNIERVLWMNVDGTHVVMIDIFDLKALPVLREYGEIQEAIAVNEARVLEVDPYAILQQPEDDIPIDHRLFRDKAWESIAALIEDPSGSLFDPQTRGPLVTAAAGCADCSDKTIYKRLRRYWQGGQTKNALLPRFDRCGGRGKERLQPESPSKAPKRGYPNALAKAGSERSGINITVDIRERFRRGWKLFYENRQGMTLTKAYQRTLEKFFNVGFRWEDDVRIPILSPANELPTFGQFRYWYEKERDPQRVLISRKGQRAFESKYRPVLGDSRQMAFGPGSLYQVDATPSDIHLVSSLDRSQIIGRPTLYFVVDVFSGLIAGLSVTVEGAGWLAAMLALENAATDKVAFCQEYGISIAEDEWPSHHVPEAVLADRGELEGYNADNLVNALGIRVHNTPPYRGDLKGFVERHFRTANDEMIRGLPGEVRKLRERGDPDYRLEACLTLHEFTKLMIYHILDLNTYHRIREYPLDADMIADHVEPYPLDLWHWGIRNRVGHLRSISPDIVRLNLLPQETASVTQRGILFRSLHYTCNLASEEQWFVQAKERGRWKIPVVFDPRKTDVIYLRLDEGRRVERCELLPRERTFQGRDWDEMLQYFENRRINQAQARTREQQAQARQHAYRDQIVSQAAKKTREAVAGMSKREHLQGVRENRQAERDREREANAWDLAPGEPSDQFSSQDTIDQINKFEQNRYVPPPEDIESLRRLREERLRNDR